MFSTSDESTFSGYMQQKLDFTDTDYKIEVINAGVNAYNSFNTTYQIKTKLIDYNPDLIIVVGGHEVGKSADEVDTDMPIYSPISNQLAKLKLYYESPEFFQFIKRVTLKNIYEKLHSLWKANNFKRRFYISYKISKKRFYYKRPNG